MTTTDIADIIGEVGNEAFFGAEVVKVADWFYRTGRLNLIFENGHRKEQREVVEGLQELYDPLEAQSTLLPTFAEKVVMINYLKRINVLVQDNPWENSYRLA